MDNLVDKKHFITRVYAGRNDRGSVFEELPAISVGENSYRLLSSPGLALNLEKGRFDTDK